MFCNPPLNIYTSVENCVWRLNMIDFVWQKLDIKMPCLTYFHAACQNRVAQIKFCNKFYLFLTARFNNFYLEW